MNQFKAGGSYLLNGDGKRHRVLLTDVNQRGVRIQKATVSAGERAPDFKLLGFKPPVRLACPYTTTAADYQAMPRLTEVCGKTASCAARLHCFFWPPTLSAPPETRPRVKWFNYWLGCVRWRGTCLKSSQNRKEQESSRSRMSKVGVEQEQNCSRIAVE
ncbi:hypothetical protein SKAU_G00311850 [Synaphobranchus kaupii]|uniref:Uncharacterized protein n=1 Tax=Synaphobranchus kaupii TaxID=118154 RepID=A0A9Q1IKD3_SYNKA|nr:hypothetical protein SKAU_G00311850 [Synaphobranchus kaupii]